MINSILNRHKDPVIFENIKTNNNLITEPDSIKQIIQNHFLTGQLLDQLILIFLILIG